MKKNFLTGLIALAIVALSAGAVITVNAAANKPFLNGKMGGQARAAWAEDKAPLTAEQKTALEAKRADRQKMDATKKAAIQAAISNNDYQAWLTAVGANSYLATKVTATNFSQYVQAYNLNTQAYNLKQQANKILLDLGIQGKAGERGFMMTGKTQTNLDL